MLAELRSRDPGGADVLVSLSSRPREGPRTGSADQPAPESPVNGRFAVVFGHEKREDRHYRGLLHELSHLFGALDVEDPSDPDWQKGSYMSYAFVPDAQAPWLDEANRRRVLERKQHAFRPGRPSSGRDPMRAPSGSGEGSP